jgi:hypothetical protein
MYFSTRSNHCTRSLNPRTSISVGRLRARRTLRLLFGEGELAGFNHALAQELQEGVRFGVHIIFVE